MINRTKHPEQGKEMDLGEDLRKQTGIEDIIEDCVWTGYGGHQYS